RDPSSHRSLRTPTQPSRSLLWPVPEISGVGRLSFGSNSVSHLLMDTRSLWKEVLSIRSLRATLLSNLIVLLNPPVIRVMKVESPTAMRATSATSNTLSSLASVLTPATCSITVPRGYTLGQLQVTGGFQ